MITRNYANWGNLSQLRYGYPVPSPEMERSNDYEFVTQYNIYWYDIGSAY